MRTPLEEYMYEKMEALNPNHIEYADFLYYYTTSGTDIYQVCSYTGDVVVKWSLKSLKT